MTVESASGNYGWVFQGWRTQSEGWCDSKHRRYADIAEGNFAYGLTSGPTLSTLVNSATFTGDRGWYRGFC